MTSKLINPTSLYDTAAFGMSQGVVDTDSGFVFLSGQVAWDTSARVVGATVEEQTRVALENLTLALSAAGCSPADVRSVRVYVRGELAEHMPACVPLLASYFGAVRPALTGLGVASLATPDTLVEIEAIARLPSA